MKVFHDVLRKLGVPVFAVAAVVSTGCVYIPGDIGYRGPETRPPEIEEYYAVKGGYQSFTSELLEETSEFNVSRITLKTSYGDVTLDLYKRHEQSDSIVLVFPVLGGTNIFEKHFSRYFAQAGYDSAIVHRNGDFKKPENFDRIEEFLRDGVIRDRVTLDFFEKEYQKKKFASFGISRGAINAAIVAGVDSRLKYNVFLMGGTNLPQLIKASDQPGLRKFRKRVMALKGLTSEGFFEFLDTHVKTDPSAVSKYLDSRKTLLFLSFFDRTVPIRYGLRFRRGMGRPATIFLPTGHYTSLLYTQFVKVLPDYVESESVAFYRKVMDDKPVRLRDVPLYVAKFPLHVVASVYDSLFSSQKYGDGANFLGKMTPVGK